MLTGKSERGLSPLKGLNYTSRLLHNRAGQISAQKQFCKIYLPTFHPGKQL